MTQKNISGILLVLTMIILLATGCSKKVEQVQPKPDPMAATGKLAKLDYKDGWDSLYYNTDGSLHKVVNYYSLQGPFTESFTFEYNADKTVKTITQDHGEHYEYVYFDGKLGAVKHYINGVKKDYRIYDYQGDRLSSVEEYYQSSSVQYDLTAQRDYLYYADGNIKQEISYSFDPVTHAPVKDFIIDYTGYDNKVNPADHISKFLYLSFIQMAKNNAGKMTATSIPAGISTEFNYEYTYDAHSRPLTRKMTYMSSGQLITENINYHYYQ